MKVDRGDVWLVSLDPIVGHEQGGSRPCLVVSGTRYNRLPIEQALVVPLTTRGRGLPHHIHVEDDGGLNRTSWAMCEALRALSLRRFGRRISTANPTTLTAVIEQLALWLGLHTEETP